MKDVIRGFLEVQSQKGVSKYFRRVTKHIVVTKKSAKRAGRSVTPKISKPKQWDLDKQFNPFYVRKRRSCFAHAIAERIRRSSYSPRPALDIRIPKTSGTGKRVISIFSVTDAAVARWLRKTLSDKNAPLLNPCAYAYRSDKNASHAIQHVAAAVRGRSRLFLVEYDFSKFFDSIDHDYLVSVLRRSYRITPQELRVVEAFLTSQSALGAQNYENAQFQRREKGIPQGCTLSLFLANAVCFELDRDLAALPVTFARYADDVVVVAETYEAASRAASRILKWSDQSGVKINFSKPDGISLLTPAPEAEIRCKASFDFLGCEISPSGVAPSKKHIRRLKLHLALVVYKHLLQAPKRGRIVTARIRGNIDWDLVTCINELRRTLYGRMKDQQLRDGLSNDGHLRPIKSKMSGFVLVDTPDRFRELDGWLVGVLERAYRQRIALFASKSIAITTLTRRELLSGAWYTVPSIPMETRLPSSFLAWLYVRKTYRQLGLKKLPGPSYQY